MHTNIEVSCQEPTTMISMVDEPAAPVVEHRRCEHSSRVRQLHATSAKPTIKPVVRSLLWLLLVTLQVASAALILALASVYEERHRPNSFLWIALIYYLSSDAYHFLDDNSPPIAVAYFTLATIYALFALRLLVLSVLHHRLVFGGRFTNRRSVQPTGPPASAIRIANRSWTHKMVHIMKYLTSLVGVEGAYFDIRLLGDQLVGLCSQTIAAYLSSRTVSNAYVNHLYVFVIFTSTMAPLVFRRVFHHCVTLQRVACLVMDMVLDFVWGSVIPAWMYAPILRLSGDTFVSTIGDEEALPRTISSIVATSWPAFLLTLVPLLNSLFNMLEIQSSMARLSRQADLRRSPKSSVCAGGIDIRPGSSTTPPWITRCIRWARLLLALYGVSVVVISLASHEVFSRVQREDRFECGARVHPWFVTKEACIVRRVNCSIGSMVGTADELSSSLELFDESTLGDLIFTDCPALELPESVSRFENLMTLTIANSWIASWPLSVAVTEASFPGLNSVKVLNCGINVTLEGLVVPPISPSIEYIRFFEIEHASQILADVGSNWEHLIYFDCDYCNLTTVPAVVDTMYQLLTLSFAGSRMDDLRDDWIPRWNIELLGLWMDGNTALTTLSDTVWNQAAFCDKFSMQFTNLSVVPVWVPSIAKFGFTLYAHASPLCEPGGSADLSSDARFSKILSCEPFEE